MRIVPLVILALACNKPKKVGHSVTKVKDSDEPTKGSGSAGSAAAPPDAASTIGGNGQAAYRDGQGRVHGPGGPVFMGRGADCDVSKDHCMRADVWFSVANIVAGKLYRALPVFKLEDKWWTWRGDEEQPVKLYMTKMAGTAPLSPGTPIIWFSQETSSPKWADSEYEALTSSRWEAGVVEAPSTGTTVKVKGWGEVQMDTVRIITEIKDP